MANNLYKINGQAIYQPDRDLEYNFETTYAPGSTRTQDGVAHFPEMFTVEQCGYTATGIPMREASKILQLVTGKKFMLYYFSPYYGTWRTDAFYVGKSSMRIGSVSDDEEVLSELSFNMTGINPVNMR